MFCTKCGMELIDGICPRCTSNENVETSNVDAKFKDFFMSPKEKMVAVLGNSYLENFFQDGSIRNGFAVVSDKRVYFQGKKYYIDEEGDIAESFNSRIVDLIDVTGTGFDSFVDSSWKYRGIFCIVVLFFACCCLLFGDRDMKHGAAIVAAVVIFAILYCFFQYQKSKLSLIMMQYAGGEMGFDLKWFDNQEVEMFQKQLRLAKDIVVENIDKQRLSEEHGKVNVLEELSKLADLLEKGLITQEEFEKMKKELI